MASRGPIRPASRRTSDAAAPESNLAGCGDVVGVADEDGAEGSLAGEALLGDAAGDDVVAGVRAGSRSAVHPADAASSNAAAACPTRLQTMRRAYVARRRDPGRSRAERMEA